MQVRIVRGVEKWTLIVHFNIRKRGNLLLQCNTKKHENAFALCAVTCSKWSELHCMRCLLNIFNENFVSCNLMVFFLVQKDCICIKTAVAYRFKLMFSRCISEAYLGPYDGLLVVN